MTGATPASPKHLAWRLQRRRSVPPRPRSDRASRRAQIDHKGTRVVAQADESIRSIHRDVGKQYFVKISLSASLVRSMSPRSMMEFLEPISKSSEEEKEAGELDESKEVLGVVFPADENAALPLDPRKEAFDEPAAHIAG